MTAGCRRVLIRDLLGRGSSEFEGNGATPLGTYSGVSKLCLPPHFSAALRGIPLPRAAAGAGDAGFPRRSDGGGLCGFCGRPRAFPALFPPSDPLPPSRPVDEVMPEPSRGWGTWILRQRVCDGAGEGGRRQRTTAVPTKLEGGGERLALRRAPRNSEEEAGQRVCLQT